MAREILFKAKRIDNGEWVEGYYAVAIDKRGLKQHNILVADHHLGYFKWFVIDEKTLCQLTGLCDKNGNKIWENDVVKVESDVIGSPFGCGMFGKIEYSDCAFWVVPKILIETTYLFADECAEIEVIGNIFDNPELLGGGRE